LRVGPRGSPSPTGNPITLNGYRSLVKLCPCGAVLRGKACVKLIWENLYRGALFPDKNQSEFDHKAVPTIGSS